MNYAIKLLKKQYDKVKLHLEAYKAEIDELHYSIGAAQEQMRVGTDQLKELKAAIEKLGGAANLAGEGDDIIWVDTNGPKTITLPPASAGRTITVKNQSDGPITIQRPANTTFDHTKITPYEKRFMEIYKDVDRPILKEHTPESKLDPATLAELFRLGFVDKDGKAIL